MGVCKSVEYVGCAIKSWFGRSVETVRKARGHYAKGAEGKQEGLESVSPISKIFARDWTLSLSRHSAKRLGMVTHDPASAGRKGGKGEQHCIERQIP